MALNKHFNVDTFEFEDRPKPKLWLLKPNGQRIERIAGVSKLQGTFKYTNLNQITFQISPTMFDGVKHEQVKNTVFDKIRNKYIIEFKYNNFRDYFVIDDLKEVSNESENIQVIADSLGTELNGKSMNEIEMLGSTIRQMYNKVFENYAPLWSIEHIDSKVEDVKRELTAQQGTVMSTSEQINTLFDTVTIFDNINRKISVYHKDSVGTNRGLRVRENSYLKSFEDSMVSKDIITRLIPMGSNGLTIHSANPAGSDYIEDFSFFIKPFKRDANRNVIEHSDYMSDELCHALLDYEEFYDTKKEQIDEFTKRYTDILTQHSEEDFKLKSLDGILERQEDRIELLKPKSEYIELGLKTNDFKITVDKSSYYILMLKNEGSLAHIKFDGKSYQLKSGEWTYIKIDTADFQDATKVDQKLQYKVEMVSATTRVQAVITRSSLDDYEEEDTKKIEEKYNYLKYKELRDNQKALVASIERRMKQFEDEKADLVASMNPKSFLSDELYKEREQFVYSAIWQEENHTDAKELFDDAEEQLKKKNNVTRTLNVGIVNFVQSLEHKEDWDKLNVGDKIVFSNKFFNKKLKAYITEMQIGFDENSVTLTLSDVFDYKDDMQRVSELLASTSSTSNQVNMHKQQIKESQGKLTKMTELIEGEWDANKQRVLAGNETVDIGSHGVKVVSNENPNEFVIMVGGVIAMTKDGGETFKTGVTPDGVNAEMLIGKMIIGEDLWLENESGTMRFNKDGLHIDASLFHLTTNDGKEDYFDKLKNDLQEEVKQQETRIKESYQRDIQNAIQESVDVENIIDTATGIIQDTFADGIITDVEKKLINDTLSSLEKENSEYIQQIELALNHPYITDEDIVRLEEAYTIYDGMYETLVQSINESISDDLVTSDESTRVNEAIVHFRDEVKEILVLVQEILETTRDNQLNHKIEQSLDYTSRLTNDLKDEMNDLNKAFETTKETIDEAIKDGIFDAAEIESIKTALMIMKSEQQDILNRYEQVVSNQKLPVDARTRIFKSHDEYVKAFKDFNDYVLEMISDGIANDTERTNYQTKFDTLTQKNSAFTKDYTYALQAISLQYTQDAEGKLQEQYDGLKMEIEADIKDVRDNMLELENIFDDAFKDGIVTESEITRLNVHLDMLDREFLDVEERYKTLVNDNRIDQTIRTSLASKRSTYSSKHSNLRTVINRIIEDRKVTADEKTEVNNAIQEYNNSFSAFTKVIQEAMSNLSQNLANNAAENKKQEMISELNKYKETVNNDFTELHSKVDNFEDTIWDSFEDQIIETTEASAINQYINILANEKARIEKQYAVIMNNKDLTGSPKTQLSTSYESLNTSYSSLIETIQSAIADNKIIETEKTAVNQKFADYKSKLSDYEDKINNAIDAIIRNVSKSEANKVNERFETWKSSEFLVESEKISQRVSGSSWESTYLPQVNSKVKDVQDSINSYATTIEANNSFIEQNKNQILSSVSKSEVEATLSKIATYEASYTVTSATQTINLAEYNSVAFSDNYSYEVVAKNNTLSSENVAVATFISKGKGKGFELTEIENKGTATNHPRFVLNNGKPAITLYGTTTTDQSISVIYTKYLGSASNIERTNSQIKQLSDEITLEVNKIHEETDMSNMLLNSEFSGTEGWMIVDSPFSIPPRTEMSINTDDNLLLHNTRRDTQTIAKTSQNRFLRYVLSKPLTVGQTYTLAFDYKLLNGNNNNQVTILNYVPSGTRTLFNVSSNERNVYTFTATTKSTELLIYAGESGTDYCKNSDIEVSNATLIEGDKPLKYRKNSSKNVMKMQYNSNISYPSVVSNFMTVGKGQEVAIGEELTMSAYIYIPSSSKDNLVGDIYFEVAGYENTKQRTNPAIGKRIYFGKENFIYDTWVRYSFTETIPETTTNGKVNYIRALLRFAGVNQSINSNAVFYYGLPQLEKGNTLTKWTPAKLDVLSTEGLATKIALNPESIDIISQNLNINTDVLTIKNTNGNLIMKNDSLTVSNNSNTNEVKINSNGISIKKDGVNKMIDGLDRGAQSVFPYQPRMPSFTNSTNGELRVQHVSDSSNDYVEAGYYTLYWGTYQKGKSEGSLIGSSKDHGRVNRYTFFHEKRYLRIDTTCSTDNVNLFIKIEDPSGSGTEIGRMRMDKTESTTSKNTFVDLGTPTFKDRTIEITMGLTGGYGNRDNAKMRIRILKLTDYNE